MTMITKTIVALAAGAVLTTNAFAQSAREVRGPTPYLAIENEPAPKLIVDPPLPNLLGQGVEVLAQHEGCAALLLARQLGNVEQFGKPACVE
jgi:hypothetical protein